VVFKHVIHPLLVCPLFGSEDGGSSTKLLNLCWTTVLHPRRKNSTLCAGSSIQSARVQESCAALVYAIVWGTGGLIK
jgi:hypothetical protein